MLPIQSTEIKVSRSIWDSYGCFLVLDSSQVACGSDVANADIATAVPTVREQGKITSGINTTLF